MAGDLGDLPVAPLLVRNVLLTVLSVAIPRTAQSPITLSAKREQRDIAVSVISNARDEPSPLTASELAGLHTAEKLAIFYHAHLVVSQAAKTDIVATLTLPQLAQVQVLVVDDNSDWIVLQQRYVAGTRYQVVGTSDSLQAARIAAQMQPALILLDVMIQRVDGWQILSELRHDPATAAIPVIICTVLPVADLALFLGADAFLQKPVNQARLLAALDRWSV